MNEVAILQEDRTISEVSAQVGKIQELMKAVMHDGEHYGVVPGCGLKPSLLKPGAEKLCFVFKLAPEFQVDKTEGQNGHREYSIVCRLRSMHTGQIVGEGVGSCSTMETKYRYRNSAMKCPSCGAEAIIKGKAEYGGGWLCYGKKGGCGAKFEENDAGIVNQPVGKVENPDIADVYNTVLKMAKKRAHVDATITACAASDIFTQDIEDFPQNEKQAERAPESIIKPSVDWKAKAAELTKKAGFTDEDKAAMFKDCGKDIKVYCEKLEAILAMPAPKDASEPEFALDGTPPIQLSDIMVELEEYEQAESTPVAARGDIQNAFKRGEQDIKKLTDLLNRVKTACKK